MKSSRDKAPRPRSPDRKPRGMVLGAKGRVVIPAKLRRAMGWSAGDRLVYAVEEGRIVFSAAREQLRRLEEELGEPTGGAVARLVEERRRGRQL